MYIYRGGGGDREKEKNTVNWKKKKRNTAQPIKEFNRFKRWSTPPTKSSA